jgi:hypothetical protein
MVLFIIIYNVVKNMFVLDGNLQAFSSLISLGGFRCEKALFKEVIGDICFLRALVHKKAVAAMALVTTKHYGGDHRSNYNMLVVPSCQGCSIVPPILCCPLLLFFPPPSIPISTPTGANVTA